MSQSKKRRKSEYCPNCGAELPSPHNFCQICGQENHDLKVPFSHLVAEVIEGFFHLDTKLIQTFKVMLIRPGQVTKDFVEGKRARYVPPMRVYFFMSFIFFLFANWLSDKAFEGKDGADAGFVKVGGVEENGVHVESDAWDVVAETKKLKDFGFKNTDSLKGVYYQLPDSAQQRRFEAFKTQALTDTLKKYKGHPPFMFQRAMEAQLNAKNKADKLILDLLKEQPIGQFRISENLSKLEDIGYFKRFKDGDEYKDSLQNYFEAQPYSSVNQAIKKLKTQIINDSLQKYHHKFPPVLLGWAMENLSFQSPQDSLLLLKAGVSLHDMEVFKDTARTHGFEISVGESHDLRYSKQEYKQLVNYDKAQLDSFLLVRLPKYKEANGVYKWLIFNSARQALRLNSGEDDFDFDKKPRMDLIKGMLHNMLQWSSILMFLFMPVVAFLLLLIFFRLKRYYYEHLIFSIHIHSVLFFLLSVAFACMLWLDWDGAIIGWMFLVFFVYLVMALRKVYGQGWLKIIFKLFMLSFVYLFFATLFFTFIAIYGFLTF